MKDEFLIHYVRSRTGAPVSDPARFTWSAEHRLGSVRFARSADSSRRSRTEAEAQRRRTRPPKLAKASKAASSWSACMEASWNNLSTTLATAIYQTKSYQIIPKKLWIPLPKAKLAASPVTGHVATWASVHYLMTVRQLVENNEGQSHLKVLREFLRGVIALRRGEHSSARLSMQLKRLECTGSGRDACRYEYTV